MMVPELGWVTLMKVAKNIELDFGPVGKWYLSLILFKEVPARLFRKMPNSKTVTSAITADASYEPKARILIKERGKFRDAVLRKKGGEIPLNTFIDYVKKLLKLVVADYMDRYFHPELLLQETMNAIGPLIKELHELGYHNELRTVVEAVVDYFLTEVPEKKFRMGIDAFINYFATTKVMITESLLKKLQGRVVTDPDWPSYWAILNDLKVKVEPDLGGDIELLRLVNETYETRYDDDKKEYILNVFQKVILAAVENDETGQVYELEMVNDFLIEAL